MKRTYKTRREIGLSPTEAAMLLTTSPAAIRNLLDTNVLGYLDRDGRIDPESVRRCFPDDQTREPRERSMARLLAGEVEAPTLETPEHTYSAHWFLASLIQATLPPAFPAGRINQRSGTPTTPASTARQASR